MLCIGLSFVYAKGFDITLMEYMNHFLQMKKSFYIAYSVEDI